MQKYGFFGGSFNPVTNAHINLANMVQKKYNLDKVIFVPMGDTYKKQGLISSKHRYNMLNIATKNYEKLEVSDIELNLEKSLNMLEAFKKIHKTYAEIKSYFIIGADNLYKIVRFDNAEELAKNYEYIILEREDIDVEEQISNNPILIKYRSNFNILKEHSYKTDSATKVRTNLKTKENNVLFNISEEVYEYIKENGLYK